MYTLGRKKINYMFLRYPHKKCLLHICFIKFFLSYCRNQELELAVSRMMGRRGSDDLLSDTSEVSKVVADMSKRMQDHLETQRNVDRDAKVKDLARLDEYKKKVRTLRTNN